MTGEITETNIDGLIIRMNKVVGDARGYLCELAPAGIHDEFFSTGVKNVHASIATQKGIARGGHYHFKQNENFYTLSGTSLLIFADFREGSKTRGNVYAVIVGNSKPSDTKGLPAYVISENKMAQIYVPAGVYHIFGPLTDEKLIIVSFSSEQYSKEDYAYPKLEEIPKVKKILDDFGVKQA